MKHSFIEILGPIGSGSQPFPWIHVDDVCLLIIHAIENDHVQGVLNGVAPESVTNREFSQTFARSFYPPRFAIFPMPSFVLNTVLGAERASIATVGQKVLPKATLASGYKFKYPTIKAASKDLVKMFT